MLVVYLLSYMLVNAFRRNMQERVHPFLHLCLAFVILPLNTRSQTFTNQPPTDLNGFTSEKDNLTATQNPNVTVDVNTTDSSNIRGTPGFEPLYSSTEVPAPLTTVLPTTTSIQPSEGCVCDLTPDFCDIGCCCDVTDCGIADLSSVFSDCRKETRDGACIEGWLMFRANVDPDLVTITDSLFCVRNGNDLVNTVQTAPAASVGPINILSPHFSLQDLTYIQNTNFYKVDDIVLTYYNSTSVVSALRQPSQGATSAFCIDRNPAKFLRSGSSSCSRLIDAQSCKSDSALSFRSYFMGFSLLKVPRPSQANSANLTIPIVPMDDLPEPAERNNSCLNLVSKVKYVITYTGAGEITRATLNVGVTEARFGTKLLQQHTVQFQLATPSPNPAEVQSVGYAVGTPLIGWFNGEPRPLMIQGLSAGGECSLELNVRAPVLFSHGSMSGCTFRSSLRDCASLRAQIHSILGVDTIPSTVAMTGGSQPPKTRVVVQECPQAAPVEGCETGCLLPVSLSMRVIWAQRGTLALAQNHILGVKYVLSCQILQCPILSPLPLTTEVIFSDATRYPESPRARPRPEWKFPFGFFSMGADELD